MTKAAWIATAVAALAVSWTADAEAKPTKCHIRYSMKGWAAVYETASGTGTITCDNGQTAEVTLKSKGGGVAFGKMTVVDGEGAFSDVEDISELFGHYAAADTQAAAGKSAEGQVMTKGKVSLALSGKGEGVALGISFGDFHIEKTAK